MAWAPWEPKRGKLASGPAGSVMTVRLRSGDEVDVRGRNTFSQPLGWTHVGSPHDIVAFDSGRG